MSQKDNLSAFPALYHIHNSRDAEDVPFWLRLAIRQGDPILELGCGTGRVLVPLAEAGHLVYGIDNDEDMLAYLRNHMPMKLEPRIHLSQEDLCEFRLEQDFPLILLPCNTYTTFSAEQRHRVLLNVRQHLRQNGLFAVSMPNPDYLKKLPKYSDPDIEDFFPHPLDGEPVQVSSAWRCIASQVIIDWYYDHLLSDGAVERLSYQVIQNIILMDQLEGEFRSAKLTITERYGDFEGSQIDQDSTYLILIASKDSANFL